MNDLFQNHAADLARLNASGKRSRAMMPAASTT
jgi:hypothetical protein